MVGEDVLHTLDLPHANSSSDHVLLTLAREQHRIVVTKDNDFLRDYHIKGEPQRLAFVATGNIRNKVLIPLFMSQRERIVAFLSVPGMVEFSLGGLEFHR